jgi:hypothetical protein
MTPHTPPYGRVHIQARLAREIHSPKNSRKELKLLGIYLDLVPSLERCRVEVDKDANPRPVGTGAYGYEILSTLGYGSLSRIQGQGQHE